MHMVKHSRLCGRAIVAYLQSKGFPEVALHFVRDPQTRFRLALACGNIEAAMESAFSLEQQQGLDGKARDVWGELGSEALRQGNHQVSDQSFVYIAPFDQMPTKTFKSCSWSNTTISTTILKVVEMSYQRKKDFDRLSFLYMLTGDSEKLRKMLKISNMRNDIMGRYHNALLLGDAAERVAVLEASGNLPLAYISANLHGLKDVAARIKVAIETQEGSVDGLSKLCDLFVLFYVYDNLTKIVLQQWTRFQLAQGRVAVSSNRQRQSSELATGQHWRSKRQLLRTCQLRMRATNMRKKPLLRSTQGLRILPGMMISGQKMVMQIWAPATMTMMLEMTWDGATTKV